jgi:hypothetical protein
LKNVFPRAKQGHNGTQDERDVFEESCVIRGAAKPLVSAVVLTPRAIICGFFPYPVPEIIVGK